MAGVVTPASPNYLHGLVDDEGAAQVDLDPTPPLLAISHTKTGYTVCCDACACMAAAHVTDLQAGKLLA